MFDPHVRSWIDPTLNYIGKRVASYGISANVITIAGFVIGVMAMLLVALGQYSLAAVMFSLNRLLDGIDGAVARHTQLTDFGGFLDIVCDFIVYSGIVFAFGWANPEHLFYASFLIFSFIGPISSFLAYAILATKNQMNCMRRGKKSFYYLGGICEGTETAFVLLLICLMPDLFNPICLVYSILCWLTTIGRIYCAWVDFGSSNA